MTLKSHKGFTLVELAVVLAIVGILAAKGIPAMSTWVNNARVKNAAESLAWNLSLARSEAVKRNQRVEVSIANGNMVVRTVADGVLLKETPVPAGATLTGPATTFDALGQTFPLAGTTTYTVSPAGGGCGGDLLCRQVLVRPLGSIQSCLVGACS